MIAPADTSAVRAWRDPDGAGAIGPDQYMPVTPDIPFEQVLNGLNPLHYVPVVGMLYRVVTGEQIPAAMRVAGALATGGPMGALMAGLSGMLEHILALEPDQTRPALPAGMAQNDAGMAPVSPDTLAPTDYTTLATVTPDWLDNTRLAARGTAYAGAAEWEQMLERGVA